MSDPSPCVEMAKLQRQYEIALRMWADLEFAPPGSPVQTEAGRIALLHRKEVVLNARNAAALRLSDHKLSCLTCKQQTSP
jgi:hypothetical protein